MLRRDFLLGAASLSAIGAAGCATAKTGAASAESDLARAFFYGFPLYEFARTAQQRTSTPGSAAQNQIVHRAVLADHTSRQVTAPNNDTIYSSAFLELSGGPIEIVSPSDAKRYFSIAFMEAFTDDFAYIGTRATKGVGGRFWLAGPGWKGQTPEGVKLIHSPTNDVWMLSRILVDGPDDIAAAQALQKQVTVKSTTGAPARPYGVRTTKVQDAANLLAVVNDMLERSKGGGGSVPRAKAFAAQGVGAAATPELIAAWNAYIPEGIERLREKFMFRDLVINGWGYQEKGVGDFGSNDLLRAAVALGGLAALGEEEAMYLQATTDVANAKLSGANRYRWRVPPGGVPADAFWSLTMYQEEADGRYFLVENPINRFSIGNRTRGLVKNADGSIDILIQREAPEGPLAANWLPAAAGPMRMSLRAYLPRKELLSRSWKCPPVERLA